MKISKKAGILCLAAMVCFSVPVIPVSAEGQTVDITMNDGETRETDRTYHGYRLLNLTTSDNSDGTKNYAYTVNPKYREVLKAQIPEGSAYSDAQIIDYLGKLTSESDTEGTLRTFSDQLYEALKDMDPDAQAVGNTFNDVEKGYWLLIDVTDFSGKDESNSLVIVNTFDEDTVTVTPKADVPEVEKKVKEENDSTGAVSDWQDGADYDIGDDVPFQLTGTLPDNLAGYETYRYVFHDDLSEGLTLNRDSIKVYVENDGSRTEIPQEKYTVRQDAGHQEDSGFSCDFEIAFADIKAVDGVNAASKIIVEYTAELNSDAIIGSAGNPNEVYLEFSNNPYDDGTGNTPEDKVIIFTFEIIANKVDEKHEPLNGAGFTLYKYNKDEGDYVQIGEELKGMTTFTWSGLDAGQYRVVETTVPDGYNKADDILFTVEATYDMDAADPGFGELVIKDADGEIISDGENPVFSVSDGSASTDIVNTTTPKLPETGGIGTGIFYGMGAMLMAGGVLTMIIRRRQRSIHE